ncbi:DcaP family trimeric outer membrane transporter [Massilia sp. S19_KUP03_FR1]|uniref:DcaP family trimeric outer membrane transporter n=1 Tax=Massilia sp. S19_KUP03_FR1 TaxID=3025503 RepID=UPI002FCD92F8
MPHHPVLTALALALGLSGLPAHAQSDAELRTELRQLRADLQQMHAELAALKADRTVAPAPLAMPLVAPAAALFTAQDIGAPDPRIKPRYTGEDAVPESAIPGGMVVPGTQTSIHLYGYAETDAVHDWRQSSSPDIFTDLAYQPLNGAGGPRGRTQFTSETSRIGFASSTPTAAGPFRTTVEADFYSYGADNRKLIRLRHAYGEYGGWLIGQTWSTFMDVDNLPETIDFNGPVGAPFSRRTQARYAFGDAKTGVRVTLAVEEPADQAGGPSANERLPQLVARFDHTFARGSLNLRLLTHEKRSPAETRRGYGIALGASYKASAQDLFTAQFTRVDGDIDQLYGSNGYAIATDTGAITFDRNLGLVLGYAHFFNDKLRANASFGYNHGKSAQAANNRALQETFFNLIYSPIKNIDLGGEWVYGERKTFDGQTGTLSRLGLMARYSFY